MNRSHASNKRVQFSSVLEKSNNKLWGTHVEVPGKVAKQLINGKSRRVVCSLNGSAEHQCAIVPHGKGRFVITVNKKLRDSLKLNFGIKVNVSLQQDKSEYGLPLPEELKELFKQDAEGERLFHALTRGKQRTLLYIVGKAKSSDKRIARALTIIKHLKMNRGKINYKQLSVSLRDQRHSTPLSEMLNDRQR